MDKDAIQRLAEPDMLAVNQLIQAQVSSDVALIDQLGFYIVNSGGKRLRPLLTVISARALGIQHEQHIRLAAIIEFIHTATLLHDDVVDGSTMRRGRETANELFGNQASVLVGDFLYSRAFQMMVEIKRMRVMEILSDATNRIAQGEVLQLMNCNDPDTTEASYLEVIYSKTARLFEAATQLAAVLTDQPIDIEIAMQNFGKHLGTAFQLIDDVLDYESEGAVMGKNTGDDLAEGKPTLPLLYAMWHTTEDEASIIRDAIQHADGLQHFERIKQVINDTGAIAYTRGLAEQEVKTAIQALSVVPDSEYKDALIALAYSATDRNA